MTQRHRYRVMWRVREQDPEVIMDVGIDSDQGMFNFVRDQALCPVDLLHEFEAHKFLDNGDIVVIHGDAMVPRARPEIDRAMALVTQPLTHYFKELCEDTYTYTLMEAA